MQIKTTWNKLFVPPHNLTLQQTPDKNMRHYERLHINKIWCEDSSFGPRLTNYDDKKHHIHTITLIGDVSRFITGIDIFYNDNLINLISVMKSTVTKYASLTRTNRWNCLSQELAPRSRVGSDALPSH